MALGQRATVKFDAYPGPQARRRTSPAIGSGTGSEFSILPAQNANGNWVKVTQRVPVRIPFDKAPPREMIAGLSAKVEVDVDGGARPMTIEQQLDPSRLLVTIAVMLAVLIQVLDTTIANVALPHMQASLGATQESINWVLTSYIVASAIALRSPAGSPTGSGASGC